MENCVLCSKKVFSGNPESFSCADGLLENTAIKAEVTSRFSKIFNYVCRLVNEAGEDDEQNKYKLYQFLINKSENGEFESVDAAIEIGKSEVFETNNGSTSKHPTLCQECADKVQTVDTLTNLLKVQVLEIRTLLANTQATQKNTDIVQPDKASNRLRSPKEKIKYDREFLLRLGNKKVESFNVLEHGLPDLVPENAYWITTDMVHFEQTFISNFTKFMKTIGEKPKISSTTTVLNPTLNNLDVNKGGVIMTKPRIQYEREILLRIGNTGKLKFFDTLAHGFPDLVRSSKDLPKTQQNTDSKSTGKQSKKPEKVTTSQVPVSKPIEEKIVTKQPISADHGNYTENCPINKLRELLGDPKLSPKNFNTVAIHCMDIPSSNVHTAIQMLLEKAIDMPEFSKKVITLLHFILEKCEPNYQAVYRKLINDQCKLEIQSKFAETPQVIQVRDKLKREADENSCNNLRLDIEKLKYAFKRRSLNVVKLMGLLYKEKLVETEVIVETINKFAISAEEEKLECVCRLFTIVGENLEGDGSVKAKWLESQLSHLRQRAQGKRTRGKVRDLIVNMLKVYNNKWKWEGLSETDSPTIMIFQKYSASATKSFDGTINSPLFNFYFPGTEVGIFVNELCTLTAIKPNIGKTVDAGKLVQLLIANRNITKLETLFEFSTALKTIGKDNTDQSKAANQLAEFLVEIFSEEGNLDWLLICGKNIRQENPSFWKRLVSELFERLVSQTNEHYVRMALNKTTEKAELLTLFEVWEERKIKMCAKQIEDLFRPKLEKGESLNDLQRVLRKLSWNPTEQITVARALIEAICMLSWNTSTNNWNDQKLRFLLPLLELPNVSIFHNILRQTESIRAKLGIEKSALEHVYSAINQICNNSPPTLAIH